MIETLAFIGGMIIGILAVIGLIVVIFGLLTVVGQLDSSIGEGPQ